MLSKTVGFGIKLLRKEKSIDISNLFKNADNIMFHNKLLENVNPNATVFDRVVLNSKKGEKYIYSLRNQDGELLQRFKTDFGENYVSESSVYLRQIEHKDGFTVALASSNSISVVPKHHRIQRSIWNKDCCLEEYKETDVILYEGKKGKNGLKISYEKSMPQPFSSYNCSDIVERTSIEGILQNKGKYYSRYGYFDTKTGEYFNSKGVTKGFRNNKEVGDRLDLDINLHTRVQSNPEHLVNSVLYQKNAKGVKVDFIDNASSSGACYLYKGVPHIEIKKNSNCNQIFNIINHEDRHREDYQKMMLYLSEMVKDKTDNEIRDYINTHTDELAYIYKNYLNGDYGDKHKIALLAYDNVNKIPEENFVKKLIKARKEYIQPSVDYDAYRNNFLEILANGEAEKAINKKNFFTSDYTEYFTPDLKNTLGYSVFT